MGFEAKTGDKIADEDYCPRHPRVPRRAGGDFLFLCLQDVYFHDIHLIYGYSCIIRELSRLSVG
jgi:hypothetical protein